MWYNVCCIQLFCLLLRTNKQAMQQHAWAHCYKKYSTHIHAVCRNIIHAYAGEASFVDTLV